ncbi:MAG: hypothetical protein ABIJ09_08700 [Pseudomonadota bacterium]
MALSIQAVHNRLDLRRWHALGEQVYRPYPLHRSTGDDIAHWLIGGKSLFCRHASITPYLLKNGWHAVGRFALIRDERRPEVVQVAFFEALPGLEGVRDAILLKARAMHPECADIVVGLDGHLNYACGFLVDRHDEPPVFGLPYTPPYYLDYFEGLRRRDMVSYRFQNQGFYDLRRVVEPALDLSGVTIRLWDKRQFAREMDIYTHLNNVCFHDHPYWAARQSSEDQELFEGFKWFLDDDHLIIAEKEGQPIGFLLWYPDFNELVGPGQALGVKALLKYRALKAAGRHPIKAVRLTEIAVHPAHRSRKVLAGMTMKMIERVEASGHLFTEGGFIFEENQSSIGYTLAYISRAMGREPEPFRRYCLFEGELRS